VKEFEDRFSTYIGIDYAITCANGSGALDIAVAALKLGAGDEVIMPTFTIISPAFSVIRAGAKPVLIDSDPQTWNMDVTQIEDSITSKTRAILVVHLYGLPVDMDPVLKLCKKYNLFLIEDAAEMLGQTYRGQLVGSFGHISTFSFYPNKHITTGEGGMCVTNDEELAERCRKLRNLSFESGKRRFIHKEMGWNYRMTNLQAALGLSQLEKVDEHIKRKRKIGNTYEELLGDLNNIQKPLRKTGYAKNIYWVYGLVCQSEGKCIDIQEKLRKENIGTRPFFWCMHEQPVFYKMGLFKNEKYENAEKLSRNGFYIPSGLSITNEEMDQVVRCIKNLTLNG